MSTAINRLAAMTQPVGKLVYIASPYTHKNFAMREARFLESVFCCGWMMNHMKDTYFYSPIAHTHPIAIRCTLPGEWQFWAAFDEAILSRCTEIWVLTIPGWSKSTGVNAELKIAEKFGVPTKYVTLNPDEDPVGPNRYTISDVRPEDNYTPTFFS